MKKDYCSVPYRRSHKRFRIDGAANLIADENLEKPVIIKDLCLRGAGVVSGCPLKIKAKIEINMVVSFLEAPVRRQAKVVWCKKIDETFWQAGLDFGISNLITFS